MKFSQRSLLLCGFVAAVSFAPSPAAARADACGTPGAHANASALERAGLCEASAHRQTSAIADFEAALALVRRSADAAGSARLLEELAEALSRHGDGDRASLEYRAAYAQAARTYAAGDPRLARYLCDEGIADLMLLQYTKARGEFAAAADLSRRGGTAYRGDLARIELELGLDFDNLGDYSGSERAMSLALDDARAVLPPGSPLVRRILEDLSAEYSEAHDNERASTTAFAAIREEIGSAPGLGGLASELESAARAYHADHSDAALARASAAIAKLVRFGRERAEGVTDDLSTLTDLYRRFHDYRLALLIAQAAVDIDTSFYGRDAPEWANSVQNLFWAQIDLYQYAQAEHSAREVLRVNRGAFGERSAAVASAYQSLGSLYENESAYPQARFYYNRELAVISGLRPERAGGISSAMIDVADVDQELGNAAAAEREFAAAYAKRKAAYPGDLAFLATPLDRLGGAFLDEDRPGPAIEYFKSALDMRLKVFGPNDTVVADSYRHLARAEMQGGADGRLRALADIRKALDIDIALYGPNDLAVTVKPDGSWSIRIKRDHQADMSLVSTLNDIGKLYASQGDAGGRATALALYNAALQIADGNSDDVGTLALIRLRLERGHEVAGDYVAAEADIRAALETTKRVPNYDNSPLYSTLARVLTLEKKQEEADAATREAKRIAVKLLGRDSVYGEFIIETAAWQEFRTGQFEAGRRDYGDSLATVQKQIEASLPFSNESERLAHLEALQPVYERFYSAVLNYAAREPVLAGDMYDVVLRTRGLVAESMESVRAKVLSSNDAQAKDELARLRALDTELAAGKLSAPEGGAPRLDAEYASEARRAGELETDLVRRVASLGAIAQQRDAPAAWQAVRAKLRDGEAAVEIVRFSTWSETGWTGATRYAALVLTRNAEWPTVVDLGDAQQIEGQAQIGYDTFVGIDSDRHRFQASLYESVWQPIAAAIGNAKRVYLVPDGSLNRVAFAAIPRPDGTLLGDTYDIRVLWSTKDIDSRPAQRVGARDAVVIGDPSFDLSEAAQRAALAGRLKSDAAGDAAEPAESLRSAGPRGSLLPNLGYTRAEANDVAGLLAQHGFRNVAKFVGPQALEEQLKAVHHPAILHIATHGFYVPGSDDDWSSSPSDGLMRSGLLFAGADRLWADGRTSSAVENGVFTGLEATGLDLFGTDLVVLSACGTGLGDVRFGEGVFGLTRAFHEAGARSMLVSLWKVDDSYTEELMRDFYGYLLGGKEKHEALALAQRDVRADVIHDFGADVPWLWAGFVLIGA